VVAPVRQPQTICLALGRYDKAAGLLIISPAALL